MIWFYLVSGIVWGLVCSSMAKSKGRDSVGGFIGGFLFGLFAVLYYATRQESVEIRAERELEVEKAKRKLSTEKRIAKKKSK